MTRIKLCGMRRAEDIAAVNELRPDYIGFVFAKKSRRCVDAETAAALKKLLSPGIPAVGVFVDEDAEQVARLLEEGVIDLAQLHGHEDEKTVARLRQLTDRPIIQAFRVFSAEDIRKAERSPADLVLLDAGAGGGTAFDWELLRAIRRPFFLAGGLDPENVGPAVAEFRPFGVDVSSGIETDGAKDPVKMRAFVAAVKARDEK
ncbi:MAG: phosphoribosylanthranilate isomerase [Clostridia bacterium]|nr:phosphoribosylanthranilate isomerase [Clostridia bacterium]